MSSDDQSRSQVRPRGQTVSGPKSLVTNRPGGVNPQRSVVTGALRTISDRGAASAVSRSAVTSRRASRVLSAVIVALTIGVAAVWAFATLRQLSSAIAQESAAHLVHTRATFASTRARTLDNLRSHCRVMVEDPRLKSTLATEGVDEATVADILSDLAKLRRTGFLIVLSPDGKVFAQAGADELRGLDLSGSSPVKKARGSLEAVEGSWVIGGKVMDLSIMGVRFGTTPVAYLVVGQAIDLDMLKAVADQTGVPIASAAGDAVMLSSSSDEPLRRVFAAVAGQAGTFEARPLELEGRSYLTASFDLEDTSQARPRLILVQPLAPAAASFETVRWLIFAAPVLMLFAVLFVIIANRRVAVVRPA
jgi:hypothetical protein